MRIHPHHLLLVEFAESFPEEREDCLEHLIQCRECQERLRRLLHPSEVTPSSNVVPLERRQGGQVNYEALLDKAFRALSGILAAYEKERAEAPGLLPELLQYPAEHWSLLLRNSPKFHTWGFCELLLGYSLEQSLQDPTLGEQLALLSLEVLERLDHATYRAAALEDLQARAWAYIGNARRIKYDLRGAEEAFTLAFDALKRGTWEPMDRAVLLDLKASLLKEQRQYAKALSCLRRAVAIFQTLGEKHRAGKSLVNISTVHYAAGEPEKSIPLLYRALDWIEPSRDPRLLVVTWHNLIDDLTETGNLMAAQKLLVRARPLYRQFPRLQNRAEWVEGKIARGLGSVEQAESHFLTARNGLIKEGSAYDFALISLELASLYAEQGRISELKRIAREMVPIFSSYQIHREALAALAFWKHAVEAEKACLNLVTGVASFLKRSRHDPELRFEQPE